MKRNRIANSKNFMVRRVLKKRGGVHSCPKVKMSGGSAACDMDASQR